MPMLFHRWETARNMIDDLELGACEVVDVRLEWSEPSSSSSREGS
jgi:hypothetical protein